ncbi:MAG: carboxypeptidase-like regulatory domain-containing protein [Terriglobia bacterium]|jgi:hypothetical protein
MRNSSKRRTEVLAFSVLTALLFALTFGASRSWAQVVKGAIEGAVVDSSGGVVPGAQIEVSDPSTGSTGSAVSDATGAFRIPLLAVGTYNLTVTMNGFRKLEIVGVGVNSAGTTTVGKLQLEVGQATTLVEVTAAAPLMETTDAQVTNNLGGSTITELPMVQGNEGMDNLALLMPGVNNVRGDGFSNTNGVGFSSNGIRGRSNDQQLDGQNNNDNSVTGPGIFLGNTDWVEEYQLTTSNFGVEYSRDSGSVVNIVTKSGTNNWHGSIFGSENSWKTATLTNTQKAFEGLTQVPKYNDEYSGASIGGAIKKDKVFVFGGFDDEIIPGSYVSSTGSLEPTPNGLQTLAACLPNSGVLQALAKYGPYAFSQGNPTPQASSLTTKTITLVNNATCAGSGASTVTAEFAGVQRTVTDPYKDYDWMSRMDIQGTKDRVYGRLIHQSITNVNTTDGPGWAGYPENVPSVGLQAGLDWTRNFTSAVVNEARMSYGRLTVEFGGNTYGNTIPEMNNWAEGLASISAPANYAGFGYASNSPQGRIINTYQWQDNLSWIHGRHTVKAGVNINYQRSPNVFPANENGTYSFATIAHYIQDIPDTIGITLGNPNLDFREHDNFFYFGDDFKVTPNLTLNLGISYAYFSQPANLFNKEDTKNETSSAPFFDPSLPLSTRVFPRLASHKGDFGPSAGFAYSPNWGGIFGGSGKTVFRGGYRLTYDPAFYNIYLNIQNSTPQVLSQSLSGATANGNPMPSNPLGYVVRNDLASYLTLGVQDPRNSYQTTVTPNFGPDHVQGWSFGIQRELGPRAVFESRYVGNHGGDLFNSWNGNPLVSGLESSFPSLVPSGVTACSQGDAAIARAVGREYCNVGIERLRNNASESDYAGWQNELRATNLWRQVTLRTGFTWSKTTDNASDIFPTGGPGNPIAFAQNPFDTVHGEHGLSGIDYPLNWSLSFVEQIPFFRSQSGFVGRVLGGWELSGTYILSSGQTYTPIQYCLNYCTGGDVYDTAFMSHFVGPYESARPFLLSPSAPVSQTAIFAGDLCNYSGAACSMTPNTLLNWNAANTTGAVQTIGASAARFLVNGAYADSVYGTPWGNVGRNTLRDARTNMANFNLLKNIKVTERVNVQFHTAFLNVLNHPNYSSVDSYLDDAGYLDEGTGFGIPSLTSGGNRVIKFGLKVLF